MRTQSVAVGLLVLSAIGGNIFAQGLPLLTSRGYSELDQASLQRVVSVVALEGRVTDSFFVVMPPREEALVGLEKAGARGALQLQVHLGPSIQSNGFIKNYVGGVSGELKMLEPEDAVWRLRVNCFLRFVPIVLFEVGTGRVLLRAPIELARSNWSVGSVRASLALDGYLSGNVVTWVNARLWQDQALQVAVPDLQALDVIAPGRVDLPERSDRLPAALSTQGSESWPAYRCCRQSYDRCVIVEGTCSPWPCDPYCDYCGLVDFDCSCPNTCFF